jgi:hypothetical protein
MSVQIHGEGAWCIGNPNPQRWSLGEPVLVRYERADQFATILDPETLEPVGSAEDGPAVVVIGDVEDDPAGRGQASLDERVIDLVDAHGIADVLDAIAGACYCRSAELVRQEVPKVNEARSWESVAEAVEEARDEAAGL